MMREQIMEDTMDEHRVPDSERHEASSSKKGPRIIIRLPTSAKHKEEVSDETDADYDAENEKTEWHTCEMCVGKSFQSRKALFGHMRLHGSRTFKKEAKKKKKNSNSVTDDEAHALDLDFCNTKWLRVDKRGRKRKDVTGPLIDEDLVNAAILLMSFTKPLEYSKKRCSGIESTDGKLVALVSTSENKPTQKLEISGWVATIACTDLLPEDSKDCGNAESPGSKAAGSYTCRICRRAFRTHQALGGHVASHNKGGGGGDPMLEEFEGQKNGGVAEVKVQEHKCKSCDMVFGSGQSLGGHMRKHYVRPDENDDRSDGSSSSGKRLPDLNELPALVEGGS